MRTLKELKGDIKTAIKGINSAMTGNKDIDTYGNDFIYEVDDAMRCSKHERLEMLEGISDVSVILAQEADEGDYTEQAKPMIAALESAFMAVTAYAEELALEIEADE